MSDILDQEITFLPGVGPKRANLLNNELNIFSYRDLLYYFPYKYVDRTRFYTVREVGPKLSHIQLKGHITGMKIAGSGRKQRMIAYFTDKTGVIELVFFKGIKYISSSLKKDTEYIVFGKPSEFSGQYNIVHPEIDEASKQSISPTGYIQAFYNTTERMKKGYINSKAILKMQHTLLDKAREDIKETMPSHLVRELNLMPLGDALKNIHFPNDVNMLEKAEYRLKLEELFYTQLKILSLKEYRLNKFSGHMFDAVGSNFNTFFHDHLPFELTDAQKRVLREIRSDTRQGKQMNRLVQGDVGSGKTVVGLMAVLIALDNGFQSCLMAPTEILATQHYHTIKKFLGDMPLNVELLTGSTKERDRKVIHSQLLSGDIQLLIGTHALLEDIVQFKNLGLVIIDEQHRFGVAQRAKLWKKNYVPPHVLVMTATPIPRTLSMTLYGDLDVSVIDELPPGRKPIKTLHFFENKRSHVYEFIKKEISLGRQVYIVYPLIQESEKMDYKNLEDGYNHIKEVFPEPEYSIGMVHGRMKPLEKDIEMRRFKHGEVQILVATTVIEVGVDVPNASIMVIESTERFGLSQLHQLRGRVGRGAEQSYCVLMSSYKVGVDSRKRIETMVSTNDGFEIAETDLKLRGPGDIEGTQQSGMALDLKIANLAKDGQILQYARDIAKKIIADDPLLQRPENTLLKEQLVALRKNYLNWGSIS